MNVTSRNCGLLAQSTLRGTAYVRLLQSRQEVPHVEFLSQKESLQPVTACQAQLCFVNDSTAETLLDSNMLDPHDEPGKFAIL